MKPKLIIENLCKSFANKEVLKGVNLEIYEGEIFTIMGQSGCGKSVLIKHIIGLMRPDSGKIYFDGKRIDNLDDFEMNKVRKKMGMLFQSSALFDSLSVWENVGFMFKEHLKLEDNKIKEQAIQKLKLVGLFEVEDKLPSELSGGMQKRVALARAISMNPELILYDEPTTGLDPITAEVINRLIISLSRKLNITSIVVTHDIKSATEVSNRIAFLHNGIIFEVNDVNRFKNSNNPYVRQFLDGQVKGPIEVYYEDKI